MSAPWSNPAFGASIDLGDRPVVVIGGDDIARRAVAALAACGSNVRWVASGATAGDGIVPVSRGYVRGDMTGAFMAVCSTDDPEVRAAVRDEAQEHGCLLHVVGDPDASTFRPLEVDSW